MSAAAIKIDYLSDTVTKPSDAMRRAMYNAEVGDDVYGEDPSVTRLEEHAAAKLDKPAACWLPSGTMANLTAILAQCARAHELILGDESDLCNYEAGGPSVVGGVVLHPIATNERGELPLHLLEEAIRDAGDTQCAPAGLVAVETPHVRKGGIPLSLAYLSELRALCNDRNLPLHIDGARLFNAAIALDVPASEIAKFGDTVQFCLSKSLAAPAGSIVASDPDTIMRVRRWRKLLGGGMRQVGMLAAAGEVALRSMVDRLRDDHVLAQSLAAGLARIDGIALSFEQTHTNMVFFKVTRPGLTQSRFLSELAARGIRMAELGHGNIRAVTHYHHRQEDVDTTLRHVDDILNAR